MNTGRLSFFLNLSGIIVVFILTQMTLNFFPDMKIQFLTLILVIMIYYSDTVYKYIEGIRQATIEVIISATEMNHFNIVDMVAKEIYLGNKSKKNIKQTLLKGLGSKYGGIIDDIYFRGNRLNYPHFLDKFYYIKVSAIRLTSFLFNLILASVLVALIFVYKSNIYIALIFVIVCYFILLEIYSKLWIWDNCPPVTFPFHQTLQNVGFYNGVRLFILHYLVNSILSAHRIPCLKIDELRLVYSNNYINSYVTSKSYNELVISHHDVVLHLYCTDPREPHFSQKYQSINNFFKEFVANKIANHNHYQVVKYPDFIQKSIEYNASKIAPNVTAISDEYWKTVRQLREQHLEFYKKGVGRFMMTPRYLFLRLFL